MTEESWPPSFDKRRKPPYPLKPQGGRRIPSMTIAAGFKCVDGLVICADQEITHVDRTKTKETKIWSEEFEHLSVVVTGSGDWKYLESIANRAVRVLSGCETITDAELMIVDTLRTVFREDIGLDSRNYTDPPNIEMIIGLASAGDFALFKTSNLAVTPGKAVEFAGAGETIARSYLDSLYRSSFIAHGTATRTVSDAVFIGSYILKQVKLSAYGCGGKTDLCVLRPKGDIEPSAVTYLDDVFEDAKNLVRRLLLAYADFDLPDEKFEEEIQWIASTMRAARGHYREKYDGPFSSFLEEI